MNDETRQGLDTNEELQALINSPEWANDTLGGLANQALRLCLHAGATEGEAYEYLEIN